MVMAVSSMGVAVVPQNNHDMTDDRFQYLSFVRVRGKSRCWGEGRRGSVPRMYSFFQIYE
ncbi:hypothetical protein AMK29_03260 [Streptomyces sp. CB02261]|nr:hypothetical protein AMK29_03260 [Streptomyces sp. CB02261]